MLVFNIARIEIIRSNLVKYIENVSRTESSPVERASLSVSRTRIKSSYNELFRRREEPRISDFVYRNPVNRFIAHERHTRGGENVSSPLRARTVLPYIRSYPRDNPLVRSKPEIA